MSFKCAMILNWGIGEAVLRCVHAMPDCRIALVYSDYRPESEDPWQNCVYTAAKHLGYPVHPTRGVSQEQLAQGIAQAQPDLLIVHGFRRILPPAVFSIPRCGTINIHPSLLPRYRGPSPTYWVLKNDEKQTGLTCHFIDEGVDTGDIIYQVAVDVLPDDSVDSLIERMKVSVPELMKVSLQRLADPQFRPQQQDPSLASYAPRPVVME